MAEIKSNNAKKNESENKPKQRGMTEVVRSPFYAEVLKKVFLAGAVNKVALMDEGMSEQNLYYILRKAIGNGHIGVRTYKEIYGKRNRIHKYFIITAKGIEFLRMNDDEYWCKSLPDVKGCSVITFQNDRRQPALAFNTRCGNTMLFAKQMGAYFTDFVFTGEPDEKVITLKRSQQEQQVSDAAEKWWEDIDDVDMEDFSDEEQGYILEAEEAIQALGLYDEEQPEATEFMDEYYEDDDADMDALGEPEQKRTAKSLPDIKVEAYRRMCSEENSEWCRESKDIIFFFAKEIKKSLLGSEEVKFTDFAYGQYTGLLQTNEQSIILYHARHDGIGWSDRVEQKDIKTMRQFSMRCSPYDNICFGKIHGAILIYNEKNFSDIINNKWGKRKTGTSIGKTFDSMHLVPISLYGKNLMSWLLTNSTEDRLSYEDSKAEEIGLELYKGAFSKMIRYKDGETLVVSGAEMDIKKLGGIKMAQKKLGCFDFGVLCFRWQESYYKTLWPEAHIYFID